MKFTLSAAGPAALTLCLALGACSSVPPTGPTVSAIAGQNVSDQKFARDAGACRARAQAAVDKAAAAGQFGLQDQYNAIYTDCMLNRGYTVSETVVRYYSAPAPAYYGPAFYPAGPTFYYGWGGGWGGGWAGGWARRW
jgi:hypothetical protein